MAKSSRGKPYSQRSAGQRRRIDRAINRQGLEKSQALRWLREGRWHPFARTPEKRVPAPVRNTPQNIGPTGGWNKQPSRSLEDLQQDFIENMDRHLGDMFKYNHGKVVERAEDPQTSIEDLEFGATASEAELLARAESAQRAPFSPFHYH